MKQVKHDMRAFNAGVFGDLCRHHSYLPFLAPARCTLALLPSASAMVPDRSLMPSRSSMSLPLHIPATTEPP